MRFSTRDLLLVTVIVALALGWWLDHRQLTRNERPDDVWVIERDQPERYIHTRPKLKNEASP